MVGRRLLLAFVLAASVAPAADAFFPVLEPIYAVSADPADWRRTFHDLVRLQRSCLRRLSRGAELDLSGIFSGEGFAPRRRRPRRPAADLPPLPVFAGFAAPRYQRYDAVIARLVADFNARKAAWIGGTAAQAAGVPDLDPALVKALMIEESGGGGPFSRDAWLADPVQVNVPGDWNPYKAALGLARPVRRNEGTAARNIRAAIMYLARKGFGASGQPVANRPAARFDGWRAALERYNGRRDLTFDGRAFGRVYAERILSRAGNPAAVVPVGRPLPLPAAAILPPGPQPAGRRP